MRIHFLVVTIPVLLAALTACEKRSPAFDPVRLEAATRVDAGQGLASAQTRDFERALMISVHRRQ